MAHTGEFAVNPALFDNVPYELERDFAPITMVSDAPMLYLAKAAAPFNNFKELIAAAKAKPNTITFGAAGDVDFGVMAVPGAMPHMKSGRGKVIGISTAKKSLLDPSWATPRDAGIPDLDASIWVGLFAPKGTPQAVIDRVNQEVRETL